jgi:hypothetical protein
MDSGFLWLRIGLSDSASGYRGCASGYRIPELTVFCHLLLAVCSILGTRGGFVPSKSRATVVLLLRERCRSSQQGVAVLGQISQRRSQVE